MYFDMLGNTELLQEAAVVDTFSCNALYNSILKWRDMAGRAKSDGSD